MAGVALVTARASREWRPAVRRYRVRMRMRVQLRSMLAVLIAVAVAVAPAYAEPPQPRPDSKAAPALQDVMPTAPRPSDNTTGGLSFGGGFSAGIVITPPGHPDAQPWPKGMFITPPDPRDPMAIVLGTEGLPQPERRGPAAWGQRLADAVHGGIGAVLELMVPRSL